MEITELKRVGFEGDVFDSETYRQLYATDASIYRELPAGVVFPKNENDVELLVSFAAEHKQSIIPRGAGTSLAGQCVGNGIVMDMSKYMNQILSIDVQNGIVVLEPGVVRDELNRKLDDSDFFFGPNTSTSNRATLGGMVGNNSSGTTSVAFGVTRDKILELDVVLSDGQSYTINADSIISKNKNQDNELVEQIENYFLDFSADQNLQNEIALHYPDPFIHRRNTGYALDFLRSDVNRKKANWLNIICGSEGTICAVTKIKLKLDRKPPAHHAVLVSHFDSLEHALNHVPTLLDQDGVYALEMMDDKIIACAAQSESQKDNLFFIHGSPKALLMTEFRASSASALETRLEELRVQGAAIDGLFHDEIVRDADVPRVWALRKAGLGVLSNIAGNDQAMACIEDTAVHPIQLSSYIKAFASMMKSHNQEAIYYAHAGAGELHLRPVLNLKTEKGRADFRSICRQSAELVKKFSGSLSGEHGDGRVRAPFIHDFYGDTIYTSFLKLKDNFDPQNIFNPGKIVRAKDLLADVRMPLDETIHAHQKGFYNYLPDHSLLHHVERCNGSADCRKSHALSPGMCPTYQATENELLTTRARANLVREALITDPSSKFPLASPALKESMSTCLACKACKTECPSGVDVALMKSETSRQRRLAGKRSLRDFLLAHPALLYRLNKYLPFPTQMINSAGTKWIFNVLGFSKKRKFPLPVRRSLFHQLSKRKRKSKTTKHKKVILALDEFVNYYDNATGLACFELLEKLGYDVDIIPYDSGRALISKGYLEKASALAQKNVIEFEQALQNADVIIGIEPSAILSFRDEYGKFLDNPEAVVSLNSRIKLVEEFLIEEVEQGQFSFETLKFKENVKIIHHVHCHQRALSDSNAVSKLLNLIPRWSCEQINTGCCGMAGGFGYEEEHYELSQKVANLGLFPSINSNPEHYIVASGMSCRHQIRDGVQRKARHPAELLLKFMN